MVVGLMGLVALLEIWVWVWFFADLGLGFAGDWLWGRTTCYSKKIMKGINNKKKRLERYLINLFCFDVFGYKESTRKAKEIIRIDFLRMWIMFWEEHKEHEYILLKKERNKKSIKLF